MEIQALGKMQGGQDGALWENFLFRLDRSGNCSVYDLANLQKGEDGSFLPQETFLVDKADVLLPHSNSVMFGAFYHKSDRFPLLYTNIYNNYRDCEEKRKGITCAYRILEEDGKFSCRLVQVIEIGFTEDPVWRSEAVEDVRPYGNFVIDRENAVYYAFTMRDEDETMRFFSFDLPKPTDGVYNEAFGANHVVLKKDSVQTAFSAPYQRYVQGASFYKGKIYSLAGFTVKTDSPKNPPAMRIFDAKDGAVLGDFDFRDYGMIREPEFIDFWDDTCYYSDCGGNFYRLKFKTAE